MISELILVGFGYLYLRRTYQDYPIVSSVVNKTKEAYKRYSRPTIEIVQYADETGLVRSRESAFSGWVTWEVVDGYKVRTTTATNPQRYTLQQCRAVAQNLKEHFEQDSKKKAAESTVINTEIIRPD